MFAVWWSEKHYTLFRETGPSDEKSKVFWFPSDQTNGPMKHRIWSGGLVQRTGSRWCVVYLLNDRTETGACKAIPMLALFNVWMLGWCKVNFIINKPAYGKIKIRCLTHITYPLLFIRKPCSNNYGILFSYSRYTYLLIKSMY